jgi:hypothetical protein
MDGTDVADGWGTGMLEVVGPRLGTTRRNACIVELLKSLAPRIEKERHLRSARFVALFDAVFMGHKDNRVM